MQLYKPFRGIELQDDSTDDCGIPMKVFSIARPQRTPPRQREDGYILLTLLLAVALMGIFAAMVMVPVKFEMQREREEEMIHRGVQYSRAIRSYYKKYGRYPTRLEDLDYTNNLRYLRKHYKDPLTGKDFKLLHYGDPGVSLGGSFGGGVIPGASTVGQINGSSSSSFGASGSGPGNSAFGGSGSSFGNSGSSFGGSGANSSGAFGQSSSFGGNTNSGFGASSNSPAPPAQGTNPAAGSDPSQSVSQTPGTTQQPGDATSSGQTVFGGGPIVGVASISKDKTIREFNHKYKYNEWQFVYDPTTDQGGLLRTPYQPLLQLAIGQQGQTGQSGTTNTNGGSSFGQSSFGQSSSGQSSSGQSSFGQSSFGQGTGFGNSGASGGSSTPAQPPSNSQSPQ